MNATYTMVLACPDQKGIVATVSSFIAKQGGFIEDSEQHSDHGSGWFFMRFTINLVDAPCTQEVFIADFEVLAKNYDMTVHMWPTAKPKRLVLMVSKEAHCLEDVLYRWQAKDLFANIVGVISNHADLRERTQWYGIPFYHLPIIKSNKQAHFQEITTLLSQLKPDVLVLARYMQILPLALCARYSGKIINIHHSFLPSFVGASPYKQAYEKGVKLIGATSHYVTADLDQGPIIEDFASR